MHFYSVGLMFLNISNEIETGVFNIQNCIPWPLTSDKKNFNHPKKCSLKAKSENCEIWICFFPNERTPDLLRIKLKFLERFSTISRSWLSKSSRWLENDEFAKNYLFANFSGRLQFINLVTVMSAQMAEHWTTCSNVMSSNTLGSIFFPLEKNFVDLTTS